MTTVGKAGKYYALYFDKVATCYSPADSVTITIVTCVPFTVSNSAAQTVTPRQAKTGTASTDLAPTDGNGVYTYSVDNSGACTPVAGATALPAGSNLTFTNLTTGAHTYTSPATVGNYFCIKVCNSSVPTATCITKTYTLTVSATSPVATIVCNSTQMIPAPVAGTASSHALHITLNVTTIGTFTPVTVTGLGFTVSSLPYSINATATGIKTYVIPIHYDGMVLTNNLQFIVGSAGSCVADMTITPKVVSKNICSLDGCTAIVPGGLTK